MREKFAPSPSRTYVAICFKTNFDGHYFRKFHLPKFRETEGWKDDNGVWVEGSYTPINENSTAQASWYFLNVLNFVACIEGCIAFEQYQDIEDQDQLNRESAERLRKEFPNLYSPDNFVEGSQKHKEAMGQ